jgi:hypothetical protein
MTGPRAFRGALVALSAAAVCAAAAGGGAIVDFLPSAIMKCFFEGRGTDDSGCIRAVYTVHAPASGLYEALSDCELARSSLTTLRVNGLPLLLLNTTTTLLLPPLPLRAGPNIVEVPLHTGSSSCAAASPSSSSARLTVWGALPPPRVGAQLPYVELEAENATATTGTLVGPSYEFLTLPAEASHRMAVELLAGQWVDFTVPEGSSVNALAIRYSVPDAVAGGGLETPLLIEMGGEVVANVTLTSNFSWYYGLYPFSKNPSDGLAHHFFDEVNVMLPRTFPSGTVLRLYNPHNGSSASSASDPPPGDTCSVITANKKDCGFNGINETTCTSAPRSCCWQVISPNPTNIPFCFFPLPSPPPPPTPGNVTVTIDLVDLYLVGDPVPQPAGSLSVLAYGADPTGTNDSSAAVVAAIAAAVQGNPGSPAVYLPPGTFLVPRHIDVPSHLSLTGAGPWYSTLTGLGIGLYGGGGGSPSSNVLLQGFSVVGHTQLRDDSEPDQGVGGAFSDSIVTDLAISHTKCGMWLEGPLDAFLVSSVRIHDTTADGINFHRGVTNSVVEHSTVRNTGDDNLAMWSQLPLADVNNTFRYNTLQTPVLANHLAIYGGANNSLVGNFAADTLTEGGGLHVGNRFGSVPVSGVTTIAGNEVQRGGYYDTNWHYGVGALWFYALDEAMTGSILATNNTLSDSPFEAVQFTGQPGVSNVVLDGLAVHNVGTFVLQLQAASGNATVANVVADGAQYAGVYSCPGTTFTLVEGGGNAGWNNTPQCGFPPPPPPPVRRRRGGE